MIQVVVRADASARLGTGHLRRCLALARALVDCGAAVRFLAHPLDGSARALLGRLPFDTLWLPETTLPEDPQAVLALLRGSGTELLVVDHYRLGAEWHEAVRHGLGCRLAVIDDLADRLLAPDLLVDPNFHPDHALKFAGRLSREPKWLVGPRFALLDPAYASAPRYRFRETVQSIGIFMGGSDPTDACSAALQACREVAGFAGSIEVVSSRLSPHFEGLQSACARWPDTGLLADLPDLAGFFARHDLQLGAGGGATWERCCIGAPTIACLVAENQMATLPHLQALGVLVWADGRPNLAKSLGASLRQLLDDPMRRRELGQRGARLVDGRGAARVAAVLAGVAAVGLRPRPAQAGDAQLLLDWANDPLVRSNAFSVQTITAPQHAQWLQERLANPGRCRIFIIEASNGIPVGQVRFDWREPCWEIGYSVDALFRQTGLARPMLQVALAAFAPVAASAQIVGRVKFDNPTSAQVFRRLGFVQSEAVDERGSYWLFSRDQA